MPPRGPANPERSFGVSVGAVLCALAAILVWRGSPTAAVTLGVSGAALVVLGWLLPRSLYWPSKVWWRLVHVLGYVNARIILTVLFAVLLVPLGLLWRLTGKDPLARRRSAWPGWSPYPARYRDPKHYSRMY
jgi:hypothetical protein